MPAHKAANEPLAGEEKLVRRAQQGNSGAFGTLYEAYVERIYRYVYFRVPESATAEDITAQTFLKAWDRLDSYRPGGVPFVGWLYRIAHNAVIDHYRGAKVQVSLDDEAGPLRQVSINSTGSLLASEARELDDQIELKLETQRVRTALETLTEDQQEVIILKFFVGLGAAEIALQLGKEPGAVRALQMRALHSLARSLQLETE